MSTVYLEGVGGGSKWCTSAGRPRLGWMDSMKVAWGSRGMTAVSALRVAEDRKQWRD